MPFNVQQQAMKNLIEKREPSFGKCNRKAPGTRMGTLIDWREGSIKAGKDSSRYGHALRDGR